MDDHLNVQITMHRIPVGSGPGAAVLIAILLAGMYAELPGVRPAVWAGAAGIAFALALIWWRRPVTR